MRMRHAALHSQPGAYGFFFWTGVLVYLGEVIFFLFQRALNLDEGWYLLAAKLVQEGRLLYVDFNYTQGPVLPYVYAALSLLQPPTWLTGRLITASLAVTTTAITVWTARKLFGSETCLLTLWAIALGWFAMGEYAYVASYALAGLFLVAGVSAWLAGQSRWHYWVATLFLSLAVGVRLSVVAALVVFWTAVLIERGLSRREKAVVYGFSFVMLGVLGAPFVVRDPDLVRYNLVGFHTDRVTLVEMLARWPNIVGSNLVVFCAFWFLAALSLASPRSLLRREEIASRWLFGVVLSLFIAHLIPRTTDSYYNTLQYPLMAMLMGHWLEPMVLSGTPLRKFALLGVLLLSNAWSQWEAISHYLVLVPNSKPLADLSAAATFIQGHVAARCATGSVTLMPLLSLETKTPLLSGLEMGIFAYRPTWDSALSRRYNLVNNEILADMLSRPDVGWAVFSGYDWNNHLVGHLEPMKDALKKEYRWVRTWPRLGPVGEEVYLYVRRGCLQEEPAHSTSLLWQGNIRLEGFTWEVEDRVLNIALFWRARPVEKDYTVFVHILDEQGRFLHGEDEQPCHNTCPTTSWGMEELIRDEHLLKLPALPSGTYQVEIGLYDAQIQRLPLTSGQDAAILFSFEGRENNAALK